MSEPVHRSGYVAIVGRPNVGKSTLLNRLLGEKISIVSRRPQTTRNRVLGIYSRDDCQVLFVDTPGIHESDKLLNKRMVADADAAMQQVDAVLMLVDVTHRPDPEAHTAVLQRLENVNVPVVIALNKVDTIKKDALLPIIASWSDVGDWAAVVPISAQTGDGVGDLLGVLVGSLPEGPAWFPADQITDAPERFVVAELIREQIFGCLDKELPYATAVEIEEFDESERERRIRIAAKIWVERDSQKGIVIGKGGAMIKRIGTRSRAAIERLLGCSVRLDLHVGVDASWTRNRRGVEQRGWFGRSGGAQ